MDPILQKFLQAEQDFFHAVDVDQRLLEDFATRWQTLWSEWEHRLHQADHKTRLLVDGVVSRVEGLAADLQAFESRSRSLGNDLFSDLEDVFASLTLEDSNLPCSESALFEVFKVPESPLQDSGAISPAQWLLCNLHNPYPLPHMRFSNPAMNSKRVKDWFAKARQRIGWTRLLRDRFAGCRSLATDAAFRAFVRDDPTNPLDDDLRTAFLAIKSHAELVYGKEDVSHPSHKRLRSVSPTPSLTFSCSSEDTEVTDDENSLSPSANGDFKRSTKRAPPDTSDTPPLKRRRLACRCHKYATLTVSRSYPQTSSVSSQSNGIASQRKRKRRLSESDNDDTRPKRPRGIEGGRLHIVSDSHLATVAPAWFDPDQSFRLPSPVSTGPVELHSFDLDFFNPPSLPSGVISSIPGESTFFNTSSRCANINESTHRRCFHHRQPIHSV